MQRTSINDLVAKAKSEIEELSVEEVKGEMSEGTVTLVDIRDFVSVYLKELSLVLFRPPEE